MLKKGLNIFDLYNIKIDFKGSYITLIQNLKKSFQSDSNMSKWKLVRENLQELAQEMRRTEQGVWKCQCCEWPTFTSKRICDRCGTVSKFRCLVHEMIKKNQERKHEAALRKKAAAEKEAKRIKITINIW